MMEKRENPAMDRFSNLPGHIIPHIMSFLPTKDSTQMSILSNTFHSSWRSVPVMDFDYSLFRRSCSLCKRHTEPFLNFIANSLQHRVLITHLEKLRFYGFPGDELDNRIKRMIDFDIENNVRELELRFVTPPCRITYCLPPAIFSAKSIKILTLMGIDSVPQDLISSCPCMEIFNLVTCSGLETVTLASIAKLKALKIQHCYGMKDIHFESAAVCLESFTCFGYELKPDSNSVPLKFNISFSTTPNLKHLWLQNQIIPDRLMESKLAEFHYLETLKMDSCSASKEEEEGEEEKKVIKFRLENLKTLELYELEFDKVEIQAPSMISFTYTSSSLSVGPSEIDISNMCTNLKHLEFRGNDIPYRWIANNFSEFHFLETLKLDGYSCNKINFHFEYLKTLELYEMVVDQVEIDAPSMVSFKYTSIYVKSTDIDMSSRCTKLKYLEFRGKYLPYRWIANDFSEFHFLKTLKLKGCSTSKKVNVHFEYIKTLVFHLINVDQVEIEAPSMVSLSCRFLSFDGPPEIDISSRSSANLKHLRFHGMYIPDVWIKHNFSNFLSLEILELPNCCRLKEIKLCLEYLKSLKLESCVE